MDLNYYNKYIKYKNKYLKIKGGTVTNQRVIDENQRNGYYDKLCKD